MTSTERIPTTGDFANPYIGCDRCEKRVTHVANSLNQPCNHLAGATSSCLTWSPVDGCRCIAWFGTRDHGDPPELP